MLFKLLSYCYLNPQGFIFFSDSPSHPIEAVSSCVVFSWWLGTMITCYINWSLHHFATSFPIQIHCMVSFTYAVYFFFALVMVWTALIVAQKVILPSSRSCTLIISNWPWCQVPVYSSGAFLIILCLCFQGLHICPSPVLSYAWVLF